MDIIRFIGGIAFGLVVGWTTYFILRRAKPKTLNDLTLFIGIIGGSAVTTLFDADGEGFAGYAIGLAIGFFAYYVVFLSIVGVHAVHEPIMKSGKKQGESLIDTGIMGASQPPEGAEPAEPAGEIIWGAVRKRKK